LGNRETGHITHRVTHIFPVSLQALPPVFSHAGPQSAEPEATGARSDKIEKEWLTHPQPVDTTLAQGSNCCNARAKMDDGIKERRRAGVPPELAGKLVMMGDACARLNCSRWTIYRLIKRGELAVSPRKIGSALAITKKSLDAHLRRIGQGA
jgi:excisionase family DNA binding protein